MKKLIEKYFDYIIEAINDEDDKNFDKKTKKEKLNYLYATFVSEYWHKYNKKYYKFDKQRAFTSYIQGLPSCLSIVYSNYDIIQLAKKLDYIKENATKEREWFIVENYFKFIASLVFQLFKKYKIL